MDSKKLEKILNDTNKELNIKPKEEKECDILIDALHQKKRDIKDVFETIKKKDY